MHRQKSWVDRQKNMSMLSIAFQYLSNLVWVLLDMCGRAIMTISIYFIYDGQSVRFDANKNTVLDKQLS